MEPDEWRALLQRCSDVVLNQAEEEGIIEDYDRYFCHRLTPEILATRWLGYPPATPEAIAVTEARLGLSLPPSLRTFYQVTNGWRTVSNRVFEVLPVESIGWVRDLSPVLYKTDEQIEEMREEIPYLASRLGMTGPKAFEEYATEQNRYIDEEHVWVSRSVVTSL